MIPFESLPLREMHELICATILPRIENASNLETCFSKTATGYIWEIRTKQPGVFFAADAQAMLDTYRSLKDFQSLDELRTVVGGLAHHVGRLADKLEKHGDK